MLDPNSDEIYAVLELMEKQGGSFVKKLAELFYVADLNNRRRLLRCFNDYFMRYAEMLKGCKD